jgi:hypothetical protein
VRRSRVRQSIDGALVPLLEPDEQQVGGAAVWMADRRRRVPLLFTSRALYFVALTDRRLLVFDTPRRRRPLLEADLLLAKRLESLRLRRVAKRPPLLQVSIGVGKTREVVFEFRPGDRQVAQALIERLPAPHPAESAADAPDESPGESPGESLGEPGESPDEPREAASGHS